MRSSQASVISGEGLVTSLWTHRLGLSFGRLPPLCSGQRRRLLRAAGYLTEVQAHFGVVVKWIQRLWNVSLLLSTLHNKTHVVS